MKNIQTKMYQWLKTCRAKGFVSVRQIKIPKLSYRGILVLVFLLAMILGGFWLWNAQTPAEVEDFTQYEKAGEAVDRSLLYSASLPITEEDEAYVVTDSLSSGIQIDYAGKEPADGKDPAQALQIHFPKDYQNDPIEVKLDKGRSILIHDTGKENGGYTDEVFARPIAKASTSESSLGASWWSKIFDGKDKPKAEYLGYASKDGRRTIYYNYAHDQARGEKILKQWIVYKEASGEEKESYRFENARLHLNESGQVEVSYYGEQEKQNEKATADVDQSLLDRAERTLKKETGQGLEEKSAPDFVIPEAYYIDVSGSQHDLNWQLSEDGQEISVNFTPAKEEYPLAFDPTLSFTAPGQSNTGTAIDGEASSGLGYALASGDFNADGKTDLTVSAPYYSTDTGRVYIFYNDGSIPTTASTADVTITGEAASNYFGVALAAGDFNADGKTDLAVGAEYYSSNTGRVYIFYNDGSIPTTAATADVIITGESSSAFGVALAAGDFNADGKTDLAVGAEYYSSNTGRVYIFYNDGSIPTTAATADVTITGNASSDRFGISFAVADLNADGKVDLAVGASTYSSNTGRAYIFYNDGSIPTTAATADVTITGETTTNFFGQSLAVGDFNFDGKVDLAVGASGYSSFTGRAYIFYNDGSIPTTAGTADVIITGESSSRFGYALTSGDFNPDGRIDLAVVGRGYSSNTGRAYIFYNDGSIPTTAATADVIITGESSSTYFGGSLTSGDFNSDGKIELVTGAEGYSSSAGRTYIFYSQNGQMYTNVTTGGEATSNYFGYSLTSGDFNSDGKIDLAVGAYTYSSDTGRAYIFYNDGSIPTTAGTADVTITGGATNNKFGAALTAGDFNADGKTDLAVGAYAYSSNTGRAYLFYNDGSIPTTAGTADVIITGESTSFFGIYLTSGDLNADGRVDLIVSATSYTSLTGRAYLFYNDGSIPTTAATADVIITGESTLNQFGIALTAGDFNADGKTDLAVGANTYSSDTGRAYIFYNDGSIPTTAGTADVIISGETNSDFGIALTAGDFNADGKTDLAVGASFYSSDTGRAYIFYNDGSIPTTAATADVIITGETSSRFGYSLITGDFNADGKTDLAVGANTYSSNTGRAYIFYNDGSIPTAATDADVAITGTNTSDSFGVALTAGDFNADGKTDIVVGASGWNANMGRTYFYETRDNYAWQLQLQTLSAGGPRVQPNIFGEELHINGEYGSGFGYSLTAGDFNADGKTDLAVGGAEAVYIFYNDGSLPNTASSADVTITGTNAGDSFGAALTAGDFNADGKTDLAVGASGYSSSTGRAYIFYNDGSIPTTAATADVIIDGESNSVFGAALTAGDFNADGKVDLAVGASTYSSNTGRTYIFYNDGSISTTAATADVIITGEASDSNFGVAFTAGDFNADGKTDLAVGANTYSSYTGRAYIFYNDGSIPATAATADKIITGESIFNMFGAALTAGDFNADGKTDLAVGGPFAGAIEGHTYIFYNDGSIPTSATSADVDIIAENATDFFGVALTAGDFNADGKTDLAVGARAYSSNIGRAYIFYNDGSIPTTAATADVTLDGESGGVLGYGYFAWSLTAGDFNADGKTDLVVSSPYYGYLNGRTYIYTSNDSQVTGEAASSYFSYSLAAGDFNADGKTDLAAGAFGYSSSTGRAYIFYNDGSISTTAATADVIITGEASSFFGDSLAAGDFNADGRTDLAVGGYGYSSNTGRTYLFYNDGSIPTTAATADVIITGETTGNNFGNLGTGDFNADGKTDLTVGASGYSSSAGRAYIFYNDGSIPTTAATADVIITGETSSQFGQTFTAGDFNADGKTDLAVGAKGYSTNTGRAYIFYNDGSIPTTATTADVIITGETTGNNFGDLTAGDFNADGKTDLAVSAYGYSSSTGRAYIFYNDGSIPTTAATADVKITGETSSQFGRSLTAGDFNADGKTDLTVGANTYSTDIGRAYIFYNDGTYPAGAARADIISNGEESTQFGRSLTAGDFNADSKTDLAVGAYLHSSLTGRIYIIISEVYTITLPSQTKFQFQGAVSFNGAFSYGGPAPVSPYVPGSQTFDVAAVGTGTSFVVPDAVTSLTVKMWGGGGGGGVSGAGGGGGYATAVLPVTPGETLTVRVGGGGGSGSYNGGGGGRSDIYRSSTLLMVAAGGGGSGYYAVGGAGGGNTGVNGTGYFIDGAGGGGGANSGTAAAGQSASGCAGGGGSPGTGGAAGCAGGGAGGGTTGANATTLYGGGGGGTSAGGQGFGTLYAGGGGGGVGGGAGGNNPALSGGSSTSSAGGAGGNSSEGAGGGGGGYGGGGGGGGYYGSGGGGGASYAYGSATSVTLTAGLGSTPGNSGDGDRGTAGNGGATVTAGTEGKVIIAW